MLAQKIAPENSGSSTLAGQKVHAKRIYFPWRSPSWLKQSAVRITGLAARLNLEEMFVCMTCGETLGLAERRSPGSHMERKRRFLCECRSKIDRHRRDLTPSSPLI
jgi:DNA-directed RNA polymerase subunit RPC12/RpoP